jgi:beta-lactamase class A
MTNSPNRRKFLLTAATMPLMLAASAIASEKPGAAQTRLTMLENSTGGRLGVYAENTAGGAQIGYRADERFAFCSTFKVILAAAILARSTQVADLMQQRIHYTQHDLAHYSPITGQHLSDGMTVAELCAAALQYSDNTAGNLLMKILGGPLAVTAYARSIGNTEFSLERWETELNSAVPGDLRDTSTPAAMAHSLQTLVLGDALPAPQRKQLGDWLRGNTTGAKRIRAGLPVGWQIGDKTGSGDYGTANDIAVIWPPERKPIILAIYYTQQEANAKWHDAVIAAATQIVMDEFGAK